MTNFYWVGDEGEVSCVKMADEVFVDWFTWSRFSKSTERIKAKNISLKLFQSAGQLKYLLTVGKDFRSENPGANFCMFNFVTEKSRARVNGPKSYRRPVGSLSHATTPPNKRFDEQNTSYVQALKLWTFRNRPLQKAPWKVLLIWRTWLICRIFSQSGLSQMRNILSTSRV